MKINKKALIQAPLRDIIIGFAVLVLLALGIVILSGKGSGAIEYIQSLFRFGRG